MILPNELNREAESERKRLTEEAQDFICHALIDAAQGFRHTIEISFGPGKDYGKLRDGSIALPEVVKEFLVGDLESSGYKIYEQYGNSILVRW